ncbi:hypothetical protein [Halobacillus sp. Marseille-P3879]|nr:hypothetical protein [Halobacillus sp. Marseille-P3879]
MEIQPWEIEKEQIINPGEGYEKEMWTYLEEIFYGISIIIISVE